MTPAVHDCLLDLGERWGLPAEDARALKAVLIVLVEEQMHYRDGDTGSLDAEPAWTHEADDRFGVGCRRAMPLG